jgi:hypothetical protein
MYTSARLLHAPGSLAQRNSVGARRLMSLTKLSASVRRARQVRLRAFELDPFRSIAWVNIKGEHVLYWGRPLRKGSTQVKLSLI